MLEHRFNTSHNNTKHIGVSYIHNTLLSCNASWDRSLVSSTMDPCRYFQWMDTRYFPLCWLHNSLWWYSTHKYWFGGSCSNSCCCLINRRITLLAMKLQNVNFMTTPRPATLGGDLVHDQSKLISYSPPSLIFPQLCATS